MLPGPHHALLPPVGELLESLRVVSIPMRIRFRGIDIREVALVRGPVGWGEFGPFLDYGPVESARWLAAAIESAYAGWPAPRRAAVPVNATVPAVAAADVAGVLARFSGCTTAKVKVAEPGQSLADDLARVAAVRDVLGPAGRIRVDANMGWSVPDARDALGRLTAYGLEYAEQPCREVSELRELRMSLARKGIDVPIAADESIRKADDPLRVAREEAADLVVVKVAPLGGVRRALEIVAECGLPAVVSSALDTSVGIAAGVALAAALPELPHACGLGTVRLLQGDVVGEALVPVGGVLPVGSGGVVGESLVPAAGVLPVDAGGVVVDEDLLQRWAAAPERVTWWRQRLRDCHAVLAAGLPSPAGSR